MISSRTLLLLSALAALLALSAAADPATAAVSAPNVLRAEAEEADPSAEPSLEASPETSPEEEDEVCVDAAYLAAKKVPARDLVHRAHIRAVALCPASSSLPCATPDHMVRVAGRALSYRQLCALDGRSCHTRRIAVNSVLSHRWQEEAHGDAVLTMYDARHPEFLQRVLHRFIAAHRSIADRF